MLSLTKNIHNNDNFFRTETCPECNSKELITDRNTGEITCGVCGLVIKEFLLSRKPEWRIFKLEDVKKKKRTGPSSSLRYFDLGLSTTFKPTENLKTQSPEELYKMRRLKKWNIKARQDSHTKRNLIKALPELNRLCDKLNIPTQIKEEASRIYRKVLNKNLVYGRPTEAIIAASIYTACRITNIPRRLGDIVKFSVRNRKEITRYYRMLIRELDIEIPIDQPQKYISMIASKAKIDQKTQNRAIEIILKANKLKITSGKNPAGVTAAALYIASIFEKIKVSQKTLSEASGVTEVTIRSRCKELTKYLKLSQALFNNK